MWDASLHTCRLLPELYTFDILTSSKVPQPLLFPLTCFTPRFADQTNQNIPKHVGINSALSVLTDPLRQIVSSSLCRYYHSPKLNIHHLHLTVPTSSSSLTVCVFSHRHLILYYSWYCITWIITLMKCISMQASDVGYQKLCYLFVWQSVSLEFWCGLLIVWSG